MSADADLARARLAEALRLTARGDRSAFARVYASTSAKLFGVCLRILQAREPTEEALQETYLTVWGKADQFDAARGSPMTWLMTIARNKALDRARATQPPALGIEAAHEVPDLAPLPSHRTEQADEHRRLYVCLDQLEPRHASAIRRAFHDGSTYERLAQVEAVPLGTMKSWIRRCLLSLRACLER